MPIPFSPSAPDPEAVRQIIFARLRAEPGWNELDYTGVGYALYVEYRGSAPEGGDGRNQLIFAVQEVYW